MTAPRMTNAAPPACNRAVTAWLNVNALLVPLYGTVTRKFFGLELHTTTPTEGPLLQFRYRTHDDAGTARRPYRAKRAW